MELLLENYKCLVLHFINVILASGLIELGISGWQKRPFDKMKWWYAALIVTGINLVIR